MELKLSELQEEILQKKDNKIVVMASAASGKTALLTEKVRQILRDGVDPTKIAVITFTNMAAEELRKRLGEDYKNGIFIGTIHALANYFLVSNGIDTSKYLKEENFDKLFPMVEKNPSCIKEMEYLLLDEAQDSGNLEFHFMFNMINPKRFFVCGDLKQSIYGFKGAEPALFLNLSERPDVATYNLNENYRNGYNILAYAKDIVRPTGLLDTSVSKYPEKGQVLETTYSLEKIRTFVGNYDTPGDWAILTRTNLMVDTISNFLKKHDIPVDTFKQGNLTKEQLTKKMQENTVKVLTVHSAKGLEWKDVCVVGMRVYPAEERNVCYVAATRAKEKLVWMKGQKKRKVRTYNWE